MRKIDKVSNFLSDSVVVYSEIISGRHKEMWSTFFFKRFKELKLDTTAKLYVKYQTEFNMIQLKTDKFLKNVFISCSSSYLKLSDNYFDMIAGKTYKVFLMPNHNGEKTPSLAELKDKLVFRSYIQSYAKDKLEIVFE